MRPLPAPVSLSLLHSILARRTVTRKRLWPCSNWESSSSPRGERGHLSAQEPKGPAQPVNLTVSFTRINPFHRLILPSSDLVSRSCQLFCSCNVAFSFLALSQLLPRSVNWSGECSLLSDLTWHGLLQRNKKSGWSPFATKRRPPSPPPQESIFDSNPDAAVVAEALRATIGAAGGGAKPRRAPNGKHY
ncbi:putative HVA22-like protein g isoform X1 [Panicum miliaceum]|uniref:HVA22-like protein g isoform X1 n=1 Tax=Panicum miliaceum TaxID=4540 RepID=A0A3L6SZB8_PANMI|nr:putative HVA22-like protein g isoform X1 [Panicum miliaceum]